MDKFCSSFLFAPQAPLKRVLYHLHEQIKNDVLTTSFLRNLSPERENERPRPPLMETSKFGAVEFARIGRSPFFFLLFPSTFSNFLLSAGKKKKRKWTKETRRKVIKNPLPSGEVSRLHRDGEGGTTNSHHPLFLWLKQAQRKSLAKRNAENSQAPLKRGLDAPT